MCCRITSCFRPGRAASTRSRPSPWPDPPDLLNLSTGPVLPSARSGNLSPAVGVRSPIRNTTEAAASEAPQEKS